MEMADMGATISLMIHGVDTDTRERILSRFTERGWERNDIPEQQRPARGSHPLRRALHRPLAMTPLGWIRRIRSTARASGSLSF
jgi:hypothetical protein